MDVCTQFENNNNKKSLKAFLRYHARSNGMDRWDNATKNNPHWITSIYLKKGNITHTFPKFTFLLKKDLSKQRSTTTSQLLPTHTKLIMSDSSSLICCANFIGKLHRLEENLAMTEWVNSMKLITNMVTLSKSCRPLYKSPSGEHAQIHTFVHI